MMGFTDLFSSVVAPEPAMPAGGGGAGGLWDVVKGTAASAWDYAKDVGAKVIDWQLFGKTAEPPPPPQPAKVPPLIFPAPPPTTALPVINWTPEREGPVYPPSPAPITGVLPGMLPLLILGAVALFMMQRGKR